MFLAFTILLILLAEPIFYSYLSLNEIEAESGMMKYEFIGIFALSMLQFLRFLIKDKFNIHNKRVLLLSIIMGLLYAYTGAFQYQLNEQYWGELLRWGAICIPAVIVGMRLGYSRDFKYINSLIPFFTIVLTIVIAMVFKKFNDSMEEGIIHDESGLNYQNISYYMAFLFGINSYWQLYVDKKTIWMGNILRLILFVAMLAEAIVCLMSGGRGAAILLGIYVAFALFHVIMINRKHRKLVLLSVILFVYAFFYFADYYSMWEASGYERIMAMAEYDNRTKVYLPAMELIRQTQAMGTGLGSVFYQLGFYSHNMFLDLLIEVGFLGTIVFCMFLIRLCYKMYGYYQCDSNFYFLIVIFLHFFTLHMFSGYWFVSQGFWFVSSVVFSMPVVRNMRMR